LSPVLTSAVVHIVTPAGQVAYQRHGRGMHESLSPVGHNEPDLAQIISDDRWRLKHAAAMASGIFAISFEQPAPHRVRTSRHRRRLFIPRPASEEAALLARDAVANGPTSGIQRDLPSEDLSPQFVFSTTRIARRAAPPRRLMLLRLA
jgi:hypothetical protein